MHVYINQLYYDDDILLTYNNNNDQHHWVLFVDGTSQSISLALLHRYVYISIYLERNTCCILRIERSKVPCLARQTVMITVEATHAGGSCEWLNINLYMNSLK